MKNDILASVRLAAASVVVCSVIYPAVVLTFGQLAMPKSANGSLIRDGEGNVVGSALIAQAFHEPRYFWPRPSAVDYAANAAGGSNLSPANAALADRARDLIARLNGSGPVPADLVAASGSGLDPHISLAGARFQAARVAAARGMAVDAVQRQIDSAIEEAALRVLGGEPVVNVLQLNLALDSMPASSGQ